MGAMHPTSANMHSVNCLSNIGLCILQLPALQPREQPSLITWLRKAPFLNHNHTDYNLQTLRHPHLTCFYLKPLGFSADLFNYSLNDNLGHCPRPREEGPRDSSMCQ